MSDERKGVTSCSDLPRIMGCVSAIRYDGLPTYLLPEDESEDAKHGQIVHALCRSGDLSEEEDALVRQANPEQREEAAYLVEQRESLMREVFGQRVYETDSAEEFRLWAFDEQGAPWLTGRMDCMNWWQRVGVIADFKAGFRPPPALNNWQLRGYHCLAHIDAPLDEVVVAIISRDGTDVWSRDARDAELDAVQIRGNIEYSKGRAHHELTHHPDIEGYCRFCPGRGVCPVYPMAAAEVNRLMSAPVHDLDDPNLNQLLRVSKPAADFLRLAKNDGTARKVDDIGRLPEWTLAKGRRGTEVTRPRQLMAQLPELSDEDFDDALEVSLGKLKARLGDYLGLSGTELTQEFAMRTRGCVVDKPRGAPHLRAKSKNQNRSV